MSPSPDLGSVLDAIRVLDARLDRLEIGISMQGGHEARVPASSPSSSVDAKIDSDSASSGSLQTQLSQVSQRLDLLAGILRDEHRVAFQIPTIDQVRAARKDIDWAFLNGIAELYLSEPASASNKVRLMTFEDLLQRAGVPDSIASDSGHWFYVRPTTFSGRWAYVMFGFVGDSVVSVVVEPVD